MGRTTTTAAHNDPQRFTLQYMRHALHNHPFYRCTLAQQIEDLDGFAGDAVADYKYRRQQQEMTDRYRRRFVALADSSAFFEAVDRLAPF